MKIRNNILVVLLLLIPSLVIFRHFYISGSLSAGDAPHFMGKEFLELVQEPSIWTDRGENLGGVDPRLFISPLLVVFGLLGKVGLAHGVIVRLLFFFPSLICAIIGSVSLARQLKLSTVSQALAGLFYVYNTYYILLVDGGQVGIALAYGLFPFVILSLIRLIREYSIKRLLIALIVLEATFISDPRLALIGIMTVVVLTVSGFFKGEKVNSLRQNCIGLGALFVSLVGLNAYFLYPLVSVKGVTISTAVSDLKFTSLLNGLTLYQPHWPNNVYGVVTQPSFLYWILAVFIMSGLLVRIRSRLYYVLLLAFLIFVFLVKGTNAPLGGLYHFFITNLPLGSSFRDSSKFFVPLMLLGGLLIGIVSDHFSSLYTKTKTAIAVVIVMGVMVAPSIMQSHLFVLGNERDHVPYDEFATFVETSDRFSRSLWFPERHPYAYETNTHPALDAKSLTELHPLADLTVGTSDKFNYMYQGESFLRWYQIFGIKYLVLSGDQRNPYPDSETIEAWTRLISRVDSLENISKVSQLPLYTLTDTFPRIVGHDYIYLVIGAMLEGDAQTIPALYVEDGNFENDLLVGVDKDAIKIVFNNTDTDDFTMSLLRDYFLNSPTSSEWGYFGTEDYLTSKYQLLIRGVDEKEFDFGYGVYLSDTESETLEYEVEISEPSDYVLAIRSMGNAGSEVSYSLGDTKETIENTCTEIKDVDTCRSNFHWYTKGISLPKGKHRFTLQNKNGVNVVNTVALVPVSEWNVAQSQTTRMLATYETVEKESVETKLSFIPVSTSARYAWWYDVDTIPDNVHWIVLSESFNPNWNLKRGVQYFQPVSLYSTLNAFYVDSNYTNVSIRFRGQEALRWGMWYSALTILGLTIFFIWYGYPPQKHK